MQVLAITSWERCLNPHMFTTIRCRLYLRNGFTRFLIFSIFLHLICISFCANPFVFYLTLISSQMWFISARNNINILLHRNLRTLYILWIGQISDKRTETIKDTIDQEFSSQNIKLKKNRKGTIVQISVTLRVWSKFTTLDNIKPIIDNKLGDECIVGEFRVKYKVVIYKKTKKYGECVHKKVSIHISIHRQYLSSSAWNTGYCRSRVRMK